MTPQNKIKPKIYDFQIYIICVMWEFTITCNHNQYEMPFIGTSLYLTLGNKMYLKK